MKVGVSIEGEEKGLFKVCQQTVSHLNSMSAAAAKTNKSAEGLLVHERRLSDLQSKLRRDAYDRLSIEEKIVVLKQRQASLDTAAARAGAGTTLAKGIALKQALLATEMQALAAGRGGGSALSGLLPLLGGGTAGALGGMFMGGLAGGGIGIAVMGIIHALTRSAENAMRFADDIEDAAVQFRMSGDDLLRLRRSGASAGVSMQGLMGGLSRIEAVRSAAMSGDVSAMDLLRKYGVSGEQIRGSATPLQIAETINRALGAGGPLSEDRVDLGRLVGRRPEKFFAALGMMGGSTGGEGDARLKTLSQIEDVKERIGFWWEDVQLTVWSQIAEAITGSKMEGLPTSPVANMARMLTFPARTFIRGVMASPVGAIANKFFAADSPQKAASGLGPRQVTPGGSWNDVLSDWSRENDLVDEWASEGASNRHPRAVGGRGRTTTDALARIGLYRGGSDPARRIFESQLQKLREVVEQLRQMNHRASADEFQAF